MDTIKLNQQKAKIIAHRGLSGIEKENTCPAFVAAANRSYFGIETDIHVTKENIKLLHDNNIRVNCRTCDDALVANELINCGVDFITTNILE